MLVHSPQRTYANAILFAFLGAFLGCSTKTAASASPSPVVITIHDLFQTITAGAKDDGAVRALPVLDYYQGLLQSTSNAAVSLAGMPAIAGGRDALEAQRPFFTALSGRYASIGAYWASVDAPNLSSESQLAEWFQVSVNQLGLLEPPVNAPTINWPTMDSPADGSGPPDDSVTSHYVNPRQCVAMQKAIADCRAGASDYSRKAEWFRCEVAGNLIWGIDSCRLERN